MQLGIKPLDEYCGALHEAACNGQTDDAAQRLQQLQAELKRVGDALATDPGLQPTGAWPD